MKLGDLSPAVRAEFDALSSEQQAWLLRDEQMWRLAHAIALRENVDVSGVYHVLRNLEKTPSERLRNGLRHGRHFRVDRR